MRRKGVEIENKVPLDHERESERGGRYRFSKAHKIPRLDSRRRHSELPRA
jgi:hypothetical protein